MAHSLALANATVNAQADAAGALLNSGVLWLYNSTKPANANTAVTTQIALATLAFAATAFGAAVSGTLTANTIAGDVSANASSLCIWFRAAGAGGTVVLDGTVGTTSAADLAMNAVDIVAGAAVNVTSLLWTVVKQ
jgi:hypothetical protein